MAIIRIKHLDFEEKYRVPDCADTIHQAEWQGDDSNRVNEASWQNRYEYEADLISSIGEVSLPKTILEIGPGPGVLSEMIQKQLPFNVDYTLVDKMFAKDAFTKASRKGRFVVQDFSSSGLDLTDLATTYDMVICNDTLEHLFNPSLVVQQVYTLIPKAGIFFVSVPNWRMGHQFVYRGVFDYDNFLFFMRCHKFIATSVYPSPLQTPDYPRLDSESEMDESLRRSWNWYFTFTPDK